MGQSTAIRLDGSHMTIVKSKAMITKKRTYLWFDLTHLEFY